MGKWVLRQCVAVTFVRLRCVLRLKVVARYMYFVTNELLDLLLEPCANSSWIRVLQPDVIAHRHRTARELYVGHLTP